MRRRGACLEAPLAGRAIGAAAGPRHGSAGGSIPSPAFVGSDDGTSLRRGRAALRALLEAEVDRA